MHLRGNLTLDYCQGFLNSVTELIRGIRLPPRDVVEGWDNVFKNIVDLREGVPGPVGSSESREAGRTEPERPKRDQHSVENDEDYVGVFHSRFVEGSDCPDQG